MVTAKFETNRTEPILVPRKVFQQPAGGQGSLKIRKESAVNSWCNEMPKSIDQLNEPTSDSQAVKHYLRWYVVQSKPREEYRAQHFLSEKGLRAYVPRMEVVSSKGCRTFLNEKPLFPGYLFCRFDPKESLACVRWTKGVAKILPESVTPIPVADNVVEAIRSLEQKDGVIRKVPFRKNDRIRIARGPMKDVLGIFEQWSSDQCRVRVLLNFINYQATVELHPSMLEKVA
jgi:transcriptional antiterminator RfaH